MADPDFARYLEVRMNELKAGIDELLEMHKRYGETLQKSHLYKARRALIDGIEWFDWARKRATVTRTNQGDSGCVMPGDSAHPTGGSDGT